MNPQIVLTINSGSLKGKTQVFETTGTYAIGREESCPITFPDSDEFINISRHHCDLQIDQINPPLLQIIDRTSTHGTYINGSRIHRPTTLLPNQVISIGNISIAITGQTDSQSAVTTLPNSPPITIPASDPATILTVIPENSAVPIPVTAPQKPPRPRPIIITKLLATITRFLELAPTVSIQPSSSVTPEQIAPVKPLQFPEYQLGQLLGQGVVSEVYLATHRDSAQPVALKTLQPEVATQPAAVQKFIRETEYTKALNHPQVVKLLDFNYAPEALFYTTEYCTGGSLFGLMQQLGGQVPALWAKSIILQILDGLEYIHQLEVPYIKLAKGGFGTAQGLVHRSLKPENILLTTIQGQLVVKISDFALAQALNLPGLSDQTLPLGSFAGTPPYMSRAQVVNFQDPQPAADVWAAVACLYEMLSGHTPRDFDERDPSSIIMEQPAVPIADRVTYLPPTLAEVIDKALYEASDHRTYYQKAIDFKNDLLKVW
jgi:eukaryotic-like serine/threonine-protein kinase